MVVEVVKVVVGGIGTNLCLSSLSSAATTGFGIRSYSYPVVTVPPCEGVCGSPSL